MAETTPPSEGKPNALPATVDDHVELAGNAAIRSMASGGVTHRSDPPLPLRAAADPAIFVNWDQPQPQQPQRPTTFIINEPPAEPPFPPPTTGVVADAGAGIEIQGTSATVQLTGAEARAEAGEFGVRAAIGHAAGVGVANGVGTSIAEGIGGTGQISGEAPDIAQFEGHVTSRRTVIIRTVLNNRVAVQLTALSLLAALDLKIETLRASGSNSEITAFDDLKRRVEEFLAANKKGEETAIANTTLSIADGLRRYWTKKHETICDTALLGVGLSFCGVAGAFGVSETTILTVTALAGGQRVVDVVKAAADLVWGKDDKS
jgi:hypothetical protein